eukprot:scaffold30494_cov31-Tisochrysis_lutea.AAC.10
MNATAFRLSWVVAPGLRLLAAWIIGVSHASFDDLMYVLTAVTGIEVNARQPLIRESSELDRNDLPRSMA